MKKILVTEIENKINFKKNKIIFFDEYLSAFYDYNKLNKKKNSFFFSINFLQKREIYSKKLLKKIELYRKDLTKSLNKVHNKNFSERYWGVLIDQIIFYIANQIIIELPLFKKILKKNKNIYLQKIKFNNFYQDTFDFVGSYEKDNRQSFSRYIIAKNIGMKKKIENLHNRKFFKNTFNEKVYFKILRFIIRNYVKFFRTSLILDSYLGIKSDIKTFFLSFGRILCVPSYLFFNYKKKIVNKNNNLRKLIFVRERDLIDKIFNILIKYYMPASLIENFDEYNFDAKKFNKLPLIGTGTALINDDFFKHLSAEILENKKKVITMQHGGFLDKKKINLNRNLIEKKYATKNFLWSESPTLKNFFFRSKRLNNYDSIKNNEILIYPTSTTFKYNYKNVPCRKFHPKLNHNYKFFEYLDENLKTKVKIKPFPDKNESTLKKIWIKKFKPKKSIFINGGNKKLLEYKIVVIDDLSTPFYELMYMNIPFIIIDNEISNLKLSTYKKIMKLKKIHVLHNDPKIAAIFLNKNFEYLQDWWTKVKLSKIFKDIKRDLMPLGRNSYSLRYNINVLK